jgi:predicted ATPase
MGATAGRTYYLAQLAEAYGRGGQVHEGLRTLAEALALVEHTGERFWEAELYRLQGELTLQRLPVPGVTVPVQTGRKPLRAPSQPLPPHPQREAEACFHRALAIARRQQARSLELRAAMSLSRLWHHQGKTAAAHRLLAEIYGWFTEGLDTADLQEARALLAAFASP